MNLRGPKEKIGRIGWMKIGREGREMCKPHHLSSLPAESTRHILVFGSATNELIIHFLQAIRPPVHRPKYFPSFLFIRDEEEEEEEEGNIQSVILVVNGRWQMNGR
jgi:hypothetical protein